MDAEERNRLLELIANPPPGGKLAAAKEFGIDLTLLVENLSLTLEERARKLCDGARSLQALRAGAEQMRAKH